MLKTVARHLRVAIGTVLPLIACLPMAVVTQQFKGTSKRTGNSLGRAKDFMGSE